MTITNIQTPANSSFTFTQWIDKTNEIIDAVNLAQPGSFVQKSGDFMNGTLTANGSNGVAFASAGGSFSRPITFMNTNLPFNDNGGTTVAYLSETGSFNFIGNLNFIQTSASAYSWNFTPNYSNHTLTLKRAGNDNLMVFSNNQINLVKNALLSGSATISGTATISGNTVISGQTTINNTLSVTGGVSVSANASSNLQLVPKQQLDGELNLKANRSGDTFTGNIQIEKNNPQLILKRSSAGQSTQFMSLTQDDKVRWVMDFSNTESESGSNEGSNFTISSFDDNGDYIETPFYISRRWGSITFSTTPSVGSDTMWHAGNFTPASKLNVSGGTMTGQLVINHQDGLAIRAANSTQSAFVIFQNNTSVNQGNIFWNQSDDSMYIQRYDADGSSVQGEIKLANTLISTSVSLSVTGNITASGNVTANSDRRLKENIKKIENALDKIEQINGVYFNKIGEDSTNMGFIAQDLETVIPEVVHQGTEYKSVAYGNISALLVEGIKELKSQLDELKQQIEDMKK